MYYLLKRQSQNSLQQDKWGKKNPKYLPGKEMSVAYKKFHSVWKSIKNSFIYSVFM